LKNKSDEQVILFSAVNLVEGGPLSILTDCVNAFTVNYLFHYKLVLLVHDKQIFSYLLNIPAIKVFEYRYPKKSWILRLWFEYVHSWFISKKIKPVLWFSLHDVTPNVVTKRKVVYCHNPAPFYNVSLHEVWMEKSLLFFHFFYSVIYGINIRKNKYVIVQQQWLRDEFIKRYKINNVMVAYPNIDKPPARQTLSFENNVFRFFYPALPRVFKNFEVVLEAALLLAKRCDTFEIIFTFEGTENRYARQLFEKYSHISQVKFIGLQSREKIWALYECSSCIVFSSKMETWGLPITEAKFYNKPVLVADCQYAHETVGDYDKARFFNVEDPVTLSNLMHQAINGVLSFERHSCIKPRRPFVQTWAELFHLILLSE